jgi:hypothetical protein
MPCRADDASERTEKERQPRRCVLIHHPTLLNMLAERVKHPRDIADQQVFFIQVVRIKREPADIGAVNNIFVI